MIPENKQAAVNKALEFSFGTSHWEEIQPLTKGLSSALVFKIIVKGKPYLLRVIMREDAVADPTHYFGCMQSAASAGVAPPIFYLDNKERISITGFVQEKYFSKQEARNLMPIYIRKLHNLPKFPFRLQYFARMEGFMEKFRTARLVHEQIINEIFSIYDSIANVYPRNAQENWVSCHNDLKPENVIFDGSRPWFVDWESAFLNDPYLDLAMVTNFVIENSEQEVEFLRRYFGRPAEQYEHARLFLMQQLLHVYYFTSFILFSGQNESVDIDSMEKQDFKSFHDRIWSGEISLANTNPKLQYAWVHKDRLLFNAHGKRFKDSLATISAHSVSH
jgi:thiamine kinase-like enzyme